MTPKKPTNSRAKGAGFERQIAIDLRFYLGDGWTVTRNQTDRQAGQLATVAGEFTIEGPVLFPFAIECKAVEAFDEGHLWRQPIPGPFVGFWKQARRQADAVGLAPLLILKRNRGEVLAVTRLGDLTGEGRPLMWVDVAGEVVFVAPWSVFGPGLLSRTLRA